MLRVARFGDKASGIRVDVTGLYELRKRVTFCAVRLKDLQLLNR
ncbi:hypothetical protein [Phytoactinopolyspora endophytica]|nr:hypothetical protein [Phytoactinopolyspora endophytica]